MRERRSGVLLHPSSLPGPYGIGDLGPPAHRFLDWLEAAGQTVWQILPLGPPGFGDSPYDAHSSFAGDPALISPEALAAAGLPGDAAGPVDAGRARGAKQELLRRVWERFGSHPRRDLELELERFRTAPEQAPWLEDWCLYAALKARFEGAAWGGWPEPYRRRQPAALAAARRELAPEIGFHAFVQWLFHRQWTALRRAARERGVLLFGDLPFYPSGDSADV